MEVVNSYAELIDKYEFGAQEIYACLEKLSESLRQNFILFYLDGYKHAEIAEKLGIQEKSSRSNVAKAKHQLGKLLSTELKKRKGNKVMLVLLFAPADWKEMLFDIKGYWLQFINVESVPKPKITKTIKAFVSGTSKSLLKSMLVFSWLSLNVFCSFSVSKYQDNNWVQFCMSDNEQRECFNKLESLVMPAYLLPAPGQTLNLAKSKSNNVVVRKVAYKRLKVRRPVTIVKR